MKRTIALLLCGLALGCNRPEALTRLASNADAAPVPATPREKITTLSGKVPEHDFAMPMLAGELLPGSIQGCFLSSEPEEGVVVVYPKDMPRPERERPIQVKGRLQIVKQKPPSSPNTIHMRWYEQKVLIVTSWEYERTES